MKKIYAIAASMLMVSAVSCTEEIVIDKVDEGAYNNVTNLVGTLRDAQNGKVSTIVELFHNDYQSKVAFNLARAPKAGVDVKVVYDEAFVAQYNEEHGTNFQALPQERFSIVNDGKIVVAPDEKVSYNLDITIKALDTTPSKEVTYILPLKAIITSDKVSLSEQQSRCIYLVKDHAVEIAEGFQAAEGAGTAFRKPGEKETFLFFEVNDTNPLNALQFQMEDGRYLWNYVTLFAANINYDREKGEVYVFCNPQVQYILDHSEEIIQPLRRRGIKVLLGLLGNHDEAGLAQLSDHGAREFAKKLKNICEAYNLDGVNFDDEYSNSPDLSNPLFTRRSEEACARLMFETKKAMPDKYMTVFQYGACWGADYVDGIPAGEWLDIAVANYGGQGRPFKGMTNADCSVASVEMARYGYISEDAAKMYAKSDFGYVMVFALWASGKQGSKGQFESMDNLAKGLYGCPLKKPEFYYPSSKSLETKPIKW